MPYIQVNTLCYYKFESFHDEGVKHAIFTRRGGISPEPWAALNVGGTVGDQPERVVRNRQLTFQAVNRKIPSMFDVWQVHSDKVVITDKPRSEGVSHQQADAILTDQPNVTLFMRFADCVPILLYDPIKKVVGLVHAGWKGTVLHVVGEAILSMKAQYGSHPENLLAGIGPSIAAHHYTVGVDVIREVNKSFGSDSSGLLVSSNGSSHLSSAQFDLWQANRLILENYGVHNIELAGICTVCNPEDWYSHRGENGKTGRFGVLISIEG